MQPIHIGRHEEAVSRALGKKRYIIHENDLLPRPIHAQEVPHILPSWDLDDCISIKLRKFPLGIAPTDLLHLNAWSLMEEM